MKAKFYNCVRDERYVFKIKASDQTNTEEVDIEITSPAENVVRPRIKVQSGRIGKATNYVWISELKRFYYVRNWEMNNGYITMNLEVDVLMSYRKELVDSKAMIKRTDNWIDKDTGTWHWPKATKPNFFLPDERMKFNAYDNIRTLEFKSGFSKNTQSFFLAIAGDVDNSNN